MRKLLSFVLIGGLFALGCGSTSPTSPSKKVTPSESPKPTATEKPPQGEIPPPKGETEAPKTEPKKTEPKKADKKGEGN